MQRFLLRARSTALAVFSSAMIGCSLLTSVAGIPALPAQLSGVALSDVIMPEVRGLPRSEAEGRIASAGYLGSVDWREKDCGIPAGTVCDTMPVSGVTIVRGSTLRVNVQKDAAQRVHAGQAPASAATAPSQTKPAAATDVKNAAKEAPPEPPRPTSFF